MQGFCNQYTLNCGEFTGEKFAVSPVYSSLHLDLMLDSTKLHKQILKPCVSEQKRNCNEIKEGKPMKFIQGLNATFYPDFQSVYFLNTHLWILKILTLFHRLFFKTTIWICHFKTLFVVVDKTIVKLC